ncbi:hypothetical protein BS47DRAFT_214581 [Hydnum rufescens UP504]|uniref:Uncharacterized protein n=1 Tax=Hydnum rufescens UP504 TaxID=1448309 RepID=A0A9P6AMM2_9AGAM|nr:hypothetical protein BS47DRAFT_214581 [Hydnum rufescens UP504]
MILQSWLLTQGGENKMLHIRSRRGPQAFLARDDREEAKAIFLQSSFFNVWVPGALNLYVKYGLVDIPPSEGAGCDSK